MNKNELIKTVSKKSKLAQRECLICLEALKQTFVDALTRGESIMLSGFGKFFSKYRPKRQGINPQTKDIVVYPAKYVPTFCPSEGLKAKFR